MDKVEPGRKKIQVSCRKATGNDLLDIRNTAHVAMQWPMQLHFYSELTVMQIYNLNYPLRSLPLDFLTAPASQVQVYVWNTFFF